MQSLVPRAIAIIEFGAEGDNCAVAKYKTTKMADKRSIPRCSYPEDLFPVPEKNLRENPLPCIGVFLYTLRIDRPQSPRRISFEFFHVLQDISTVVADSDAKDAFRFPCDFFDFSRGKPSSTSFRVERLSLVLSSTTGYHLGLLAKCRCCCPPTVPNSVQTIWPQQNGKNIPRVHTRAKPSQSFAAIWSNPIPQKLTLLGGWPYLECFSTWQKVGLPRRVTLPSR